MESKFIINNIKTINTFCYNLNNNTDCTICRCNLNTNSIYLQEKNSESLIVTGVCNHSFHYECIKPWLVSSQYCPICFTKWIYKIENSKEIN